MHWARRAASRAACTAGSKRPTRIAMIAITTSSSIRVKPRRRSISGTSSEDEHRARRPPTVPEHPAPRRCPIAHIVPGIRTEASRNNLDMGRGRHFHGQPFGSILGGLWCRGDDRGRRRLFSDLRSLPVPTLALTPNEGLLDASRLRALVHGGERATWLELATL